MNALTTTDVETLGRIVSSSLESRISVLVDSIKNVEQMAHTIQEQVVSLATSSALQQESIKDLKEDLHRNEKETEKHIETIYENLSSCKDEMNKKLEDNYMLKQDGIIIQQTSEKEMYKNIEKLKEKLRLELKENFESKRKWILFMIAIAGSLGAILSWLIKHM